MHKPDKAPEPSMEEILASIRKIIAEEPVGSRPGPAPGSHEAESSTALPLPHSADEESTSGPPYSVEDALADLMDDSPQRRIGRTGERELEREPPPKPQGQPALPSEEVGQRPSWLLGRATGSPPAQQPAGPAPEASRGPAGSLRGQLESMRSGPERTTSDGEESERLPDTARKSDETGSVFDRPRAGGPSGLARFPTLPASQSQDPPRPAPQRVPARDPSPPGAPGPQPGAGARASGPAATSGASEVSPPKTRASEPMPEAGPDAGAPFGKPSAGPPAAPVEQARPADQRQDAKERDSKPMSPPVAGSGQPKDTRPRPDVPQTAAPSAPRPSDARPDAARPAEQPAAARTLEDTVAELLRPMLREWLDANMPRIVEKALRVELAATARRPEADGNR